MPQNESGNTPLHWAVQNQHEKVVRVLLAKLGNVDVLARNSFGKSVLTEGFSGKNQEVLKMLLEHSSADEDALMGGMGDKGKDDNGMDVAVSMGENAAGEGGPNAAAAAAEGEGLVHHFVMDREKEPDRVLRVREMEIKHADDPFGQAPADDTTGLGVWSASLVMARWLVSQKRIKEELLDDAVVLELGCGCAVPGLAVAVHARPKSLYLTDLNPETLENARVNVGLNRENFMSPDTAAHISVTTMDWTDLSSYPPGTEGGVDVVLGSDLVYQKSIAPLLTKVLQRLLKPGGRFLYVAPETGRDGLPEFLAGLTTKKGGLALVKEEVAGPALLSNPFQGADSEEGEEAEEKEEAFLLHFHELATQEVVYKLYEYVKK